MATLTASAAMVSQPRISHDAQYIEVTQKYVLTTTLSAGDVIIFPHLKIPHGATVTKVKFHGTHPNGATIFTAGIGEPGGGGISSAAVFGSGTLSATVAYKNLDFDPVRVSLSDSTDRGNRWVYPTMTAATVTSATGSLSLGLTVGYSLVKSNW